MTESVKVRTSKLADGADAQEIRMLMNAVVDALNAVTTKLDGETALTAKNYSTTVANIIQD